MFTTKDRELPRTTGGYGDLLYWAWSQQNRPVNFASIIGIASVWLQKYQEAAQNRNTIVSCPNYVGAEHLYSEQRGKGHMNDCLHLKSRIVNLPFLSVFREYRYPNSYNYYYPFYRLGIGSTLPYKLTEIKHLAPASSTVRGRAWWNMQPRFQSGVSMQNFLFELKDFRDLGSSLRNAKELAATIADQMTSAQKAAKKGYGKTLAKLTTGSAAEATLCFNFAVQPMLKDVAAIALASCQLADNAQKQFFDLGHISQTSHYSEIIDYVDEAVVGTKSNYWHKTGLVKETKFTATLRYKYAYSMRNSRDAFLKYWGFSSSFEALWNSLPFSFLADYVFTVAKSIHAMEHDPNVDLNALEYCETLKTQYKYGILTTGDPRLDVLVLDGKVHLATESTIKKDILIAGVSGSKYERNVTTPYKGPALPQVKLPSTKQLLNVAALVRCFLD